MIALAYLTLDISYTYRCYFNKLSNNSMINIFITFETCSNFGALFLRCKNTGKTVFINNR